MKNKLLLKCFLSISIFGAVTLNGQVVTLRLDNYQSGNLQTDNVSYATTPIKYAYFQDKGDDGLHFAFTSALLLNEDYSDIWLHGMGSLVCYIQPENVKMERDDIGLYQFITGICQETTISNANRFHTYIYKAYISRPLLSLTIIEKNQDIRVYTFLKLSQ